MRRRYVSTAAILLTGTMVLSGCSRLPFGKKPEMEEEVQQALAVEVQTAGKKELVIAETFVGSVSAAEEVTVYPTASGEVVSVDVHMGDTVSAGQQLFKIDDESARLGLQSAQAGLATAQASANQATNGSETLKEAQEQQSIDSLTRALTTAERSLADAQENIDRGTRSLENARDDRKDAKDDWEDAKDLYRKAKDYLDDYEDLQDSEPAFVGKTLAEAANMTAQVTTTTISEDSITVSTTTGQGTTSSGLKPSEEHLKEAKNLLQDVQDDDLTGAQISSSGVQALKTARDSAKTAYTAKDRAVDSAKDSVEDLKRAVKSQQDAQANAESSLTNAEANRQVTDGQVLADTKRVLEAQVNSSQVGVAQAQYALDQYTTKSPISGVVEAVNINPHDTVGPSVAALVISNKDTMKIKFSVPESVRDNLSVGQAVKVKKDGSKINGLITEVGEALDSSTGMFNIEAAVNGGSGLLNGTTVTVKVDSYRDNSGIVIPYDAVYYSNGEPYVYVVESGVARKKDVKTGMFDKKHIVISSGLKAGEQVITSWSADLRDGTEVEAVDKSNSKAQEDKNTAPAEDAQGAEGTEPAEDAQGAEGTEPAEDAQGAEGTAPVEDANDSGKEGD